MNKKIKSNCILECIRFNLWSTDDNMEDTSSSDLLVNEWKQSESEILNENFVNKHHPR